tara:strand:- start:789 stop:1199 length:411 start_codon:yes stop_codon:yes gene_type:complete
MLQHSAKAIIIAGLALQPLTHQPTGTQWRKTPLHILSLGLQDMGVKEYLFAPRRDHRGWSTPSEAARLFFLLTLIVTGFWAWPITEGRILLWFGLVVLVSTPLLTIGWWLISLVSQRIESRVLVDSLHRIDRSKKR